jgi:hypothetical protein
MKKKVLSLALMLFVGGSMIACGGPTSSSQGTTSAATSSPSIPSTSTPTSTTSSQPALPDQANRDIAINLFTRSDISIDINKLLGVAFNETYYGKFLSRNEKPASKRKKPTSFAECERMNARLRQSPAAAESAKTLVSTKDYTFKRGDADPYYYTGIKEDGTIAESRLSSPISLVKDYGDTIERMTEAFLATNPYIDYLTRVGNNDFLLHYDPSSTKASLLIQDRDYTMTSVGLVAGQQYSIASKGRTIAVSISYDAAGKETLDAQAYAPVTYSENFATLFPKVQLISTVYGAIHFVEGKSFDYLDQISPLEVDAFSIYYDENSLPHALMVARAEDLQNIGRHVVNASLLSPIGKNGYIERAVTSSYAQDGALYEQNGKAYFYDKNLRKQLEIGGGHLGNAFNDSLIFVKAETSDLTGWKQVLIKDGKLYTTVDENKQVRSYHHAEAMTITDSQDATHNWPFNGAYAADGLWHEVNENVNGWISITDPTQTIDFDASEFTTLAWKMDEATSPLSGSNRIEKFASAIGAYGYQLYSGVAAGDKTAFYAEIESLLLSFNKDVANSTWEESKDILRFGMDDLLARKKQAMITLSSGDIEKVIGSGYKDPTSIAESDAGSYAASFPTLVFHQGATASDFLASIVVKKIDLAQPDIALTLDNLKRVSATGLVAVKADDVLTDQETYNLKITVNKVTLYSHSVTVRVMSGNGYKISFMSDRYVETTKVQELLEGIEVTNLDTGVAEDPKLSNLYRQSVSATSADLTILTPVSDATVPLVDGETYVYSLQNAAGVLVGSASVTITLVKVPYIFVVGDTSALTSNSTVRDLLACTSQKKIDPNASDVMAMKVTHLAKDGTAETITDLDTKLISGATYFISVGDYGVIYYWAKITIA